MGFKINSYCLSLAIAFSLCPLYAQAPARKVPANAPGASSKDILQLQQKIARMQAKLQPMQHTLQQLSSKMAATKQQKQRDNTKITTLTKKIGSLQYHQQKLVHRSITLARLAKSVSKNSVHFDGESSVYFETLPTTTLPDALLANRDKFKARAITLGGNIEADLQSWFGDRIAASKVGSANTYQRGYGISLSCFDIDILAQMNDWVSVYGSIVGTPAPGDYTPKINQAFFTLGNFDKSPIYLSVGKMYVPFGSFSGGGPASYPLTHITFKPGTQTQILLGYHHQGLSTMISAFNNQANKAYHKKIDFAYGLYYTFKADKGLSVSVGGGYVHDLINLGGSFTGNDANSQSPQTRFPNGLPAWDMNAALNYGIFGVSGEYIRGIYGDVKRNFAKPIAWSAAATVAPVILGQTTTFSLGYSATKNMQNVPMSPTGNPTGINSLTNGIKYAWIGAVSRAMFYQSLHLGLDVQYATTYIKKHTTTASLDATVYF